MDLVGRPQHLAELRPRPHRVGRTRSGLLR